MIQKAATTDDIEVGRRIREARALKGLSQTTLAEALGVTFQQVQKYENGRNRLSVSRLIALAAYLEMPATRFLPATAWAAEPDPLADILRSKDGRQLATIFLRQTAKGRAALTAMAHLATSVA